MLSSSTPPSAEASTDAIAVNVLGAEVVMVALSAGLRVPRGSTTSLRASDADAVWNATPLRVRYRRWGAVVDRDLDPLGLVLKSGTWYLVAWPTETASGQDGKTAGDDRLHVVTRQAGQVMTGPAVHRPAG